MPKFDVVVGNPPYQRGLHMKFLEMSYDMSNQYVLFIQPAIWLLSDDQYAKHSEIKNKLKNDIIEIDLINGNPLFGVALVVPLSIVYLDKYSKEENTKICDKLNKTKLYLEDISLLNKWGDYEIYPKLKKKIINLCKVNNFRTSCNRRNSSKNYFVSISKIKGHVIMNDPHKLITDDFYAPLPIVEKVEKEYGPRTDIPENWIYQAQRNWYGFDTEIEAKNCMKFLKTRWAMFSLSINKFNMNIQEKEAESIPWLDFSQEWSEAKFEKLINATQEEIEFVHKNIPDYYNIKK
jgi:hypothetical protein